jgi:hypothetical protein
VRTDRVAKRPGSYFHGPNFGGCLTCKVPRTLFSRTSRNSVKAKFGLPRDLTINCPAYSRISGGARNARTHEP